MVEYPYNIFLVDADEDDHELFRDAMKDIPKKTKTVTFHNDAGLMVRLDNENFKLPTVILVDMNLPIMQCLNYGFPLEYLPLPLIHTVSLGYEEN